MPGNGLTSRSNVIKFFAVDVTDLSADLPRAGNDNNCPYCGGVLEPGDKASDCSGSKAWLAGRSTPPQNPDAYRRQR